MSFFAGQVPGADKLYALSYANIYVPALTASTTDPNLGADGTATGAYHRNGLLITGWAQLVFSGAGVDAGSGNYEISLPFDADTSIMLAGAGAANGFAVGSAVLNDASTAANRTIGNLTLLTASTVRINPIGATAVNDSTPFVWDGGDAIAAMFAYIADPAGFSFGT